MKTIAVGSVLEFLLIAGAAMTRQSMTRQSLGVWISLLICCGMSACTSFAYTNVTLTDSAAAQAAVVLTPAQKASFSIVRRGTKKYNDVLVILALSGGGSRAGYFSARTMFALSKLKFEDNEDLNLLQEVDLISSVSGGSMAAAYYASSYDDNAKLSPELITRRRWTERNIDEIFEKNYIARWVGNWFWPTNIAKFWFTAFDRTDIMAQTLADNLFDTVPTGLDLTLGQLNPDRPNLVLNATVGSSGGKLDTERAKIFGTVFTFTEEDFRRKLHSKVADYDLSRAVMASATFPGAFNFMTLRNFKDSSDPNAHDSAPYLHLFDGGNSDNLGLLSVSRTLLHEDAALLNKYKKVVVILVDAYRRSLGAPSDEANPRGILSYVVDTNFIDSTDALLEANRAHLIQRYFSRSLALHLRANDCYRENLPDRACVAKHERPDARRVEIQNQLHQKLFFLHLNFDAVQNAALRKELNEIPTTFKLTDPEMIAIRNGVNDLFGATKVETKVNESMQACVQALVRLVKNPLQSAQLVAGNLWCGGASQPEREERAKRLTNVQQAPPR